MASFLPSLNADLKLPFKDESLHGELKVSQQTLDTNVKIVRDHLPQWFFS